MQSISADPPQINAHAPKSPTHKVAMCRLHRHDLFVWACRFIAADLYAFDFKLSHIAKHVLLPPAPNVPDQSHLPADEQIPPLLVVNIQLPGYPVRGTLEFRSLELLRQRTSLHGQFICTLIATWFRMFFVCVRGLAWLGF